MIFIHYIVISSLVIGLLNLVAVLFLSNALFRILLYRPFRDIGDETNPEPDRKGLVDLKQSMTYDPRFATKKSK